MLRRRRRTGRSRPGFFRQKCARFVPSEQEQLTHSFISMLLGRADQGNPPSPRLLHPDEELYLCFLALRPTLWGTFSLRRVQCEVLGAIEEVCPPAGLRRGAEDSVARARPFSAADIVFDMALLAHRPCVHSIGGGPSTASCRARTAAPCAAQPRFLVAHHRRVPQDRCHPPALVAGATQFSAALCLVRRAPAMVRVPWSRW